MPSSDGPLLLYAHCNLLSATDEVDEGLGSVGLMIVGVIGMAQKKDLYKFTQKDSYKLQLLSDVIASVILHQAKDKGCLLSNREMDVVELVKKGMTNQAIANSLHISVNTVKKHLQNNYEKYNVQNRTQLVQRI